MSRSVFTAACPRGTPDVGGSCVRRRTGWVITREGDGRYRTDSRNLCLHGCVTNHTASYGWRADARHRLGVSIA